MKIAIGSDKSGFPLKEAIAKYLAQAGIDFADLGTKDVEQPIAYFEAAPKIAQTVQSGEADRGILCCGTGMGMAVVANKHKGIYAACCESVYTAKMCRAVNDANVLCMGGWLTAEWLGIEMVKAFLATQFTQGLEEWRVAWLQNAKSRVEAYEEEIFQ